MDNNASNAYRDFRPLNDYERRVIVAAHTKNRLHPNDYRFAEIDYLQVSYQNMQGGFCVCILIFRLRDSSSVEDVFASRDPIVVYRGASRRSYKDRRKQIRGEMLAFSRAVLYSRPVTL